MELLKDTSLLDFGIFFIRKLVENTRKMDDLKFKNTVLHIGEELLLNDLIKIISEKENRVEKMEQGRDLADKYLIKKLKDGINKLG